MKANATLSSRENEESKQISSGEGGEEEKGDEAPVLTMFESIFWLGVVTVLVAVMSEALVQTVEDATSKNHISRVFVATVVIPIIGNATEHASAILFAMKNNLDLSVSIAIGSSTQIALFVIPLLVILSWILNLDLTLNFQAFETSAMIMSVVTVTFAIQAGKSNWVMGLLLVGAYFIVSIGFAVHLDEVL